jgi:hypothetical protein
VDSASEGFGWIEEGDNTNGLGHQVMQEPQPLGHHLLGEKIDAGRVAAGPGEVGDKTKPDRVLRDTEDDWDRRCCSFGREHSGRAAGRGNHGHLSLDQIGHQRRQAIVVALQSVVLDRHVLAFDIADFVEAFAESGHITRVGVGRPVSNKPDHRQRRLLRSRGERPRDCPATKRGYKLPSSDAEYHLPRPRWGSCRCNMRKDSTSDREKGSLFFRSAK